MAEKMTTYEKRIDAFKGFFNTYTADLYGFTFDPCHIDYIHRTAQLRLFGKDAKKRLGKFDSIVKSETKKIDKYVLENFGAEAIEKEWKLLETESTGIKDFYFQKYIFG